MKREANRSNSASLFLYALRATEKPQNSPERSRGYFYTLTTATAYRAAQRAYSARELLRQSDTKVTL